MSYLVGDVTADVAEAGAEEKKTKQPLKSRHQPLWWNED